MSVSIVLDRPHAHFTNLDFITGRVVLNIQSNENISAIAVKLEGESRTHLAVDSQLHEPAAGPRARNFEEVEVHKVSE